MTVAVGGICVFGGLYVTVAGRVGASPVEGTDVLPGDLCTHRLRYRSQCHLPGIYPVPLRVGRLQAERINSPDISIARR